MKETTKMLAMSYLKSTGIAIAGLSTMGLSLAAAAVYGHDARKGARRAVEYAKVGRYGAAIGNALGAIEMAAFVPASLAAGEKAIDFFADKLQEEKTYREGLRYGMAAKTQCELNEEVH